MASWKKLIIGRGMLTSFIIHFRKALQSSTGMSQRRELAPDNSRHFGQVHLKSGSSLRTMCPHLLQMRPTITLKASPSTQYGHRMSSTVLPSVPEKCVRAIRQTATYKKKF